MVHSSRWLLLRNRELPVNDLLPKAVKLGVPDMSIGHWVGLTAPKGVTPPAVVAKMSKELEQVMKRTEAKIASSGPESSLHPVRPPTSLPS